MANVWKYGLFASVGLFDLEVAKASKRNKGYASMAYGKQPKLRVHESGNFFVRFSGVTRYLGRDKTEAKRLYGIEVEKWRAAKAAKEGVMVAAPTGSEKPPEATTVSEATAALKRFITLPKRFSGPASSRRQSGIRKGS